MSALTPHIRVLRAEAKELNDMAGTCSCDAAIAAVVEQKAVHLTAGVILGFMAVAKYNAADTLEAEERTQQEGLNG